MAEEEVDDYMSAEVLAACASLAGDKKQKKSAISTEGASAPTSKRARREQLTQLMDKTRDTAQQTPLDASNKGFQMLQKFGYTSGGLGKNKSGISEPLAVDKRDKNDVTGIGLTSLARKQQQALFQAKRQQQQVAAQWQADFRSTQRKKHALRDIQRDIGAAERVIYNLDVKYELEEHGLWPLEFQEKIDESSNSDSSESEDILSAKYLILALTHM